MTRKAPARHWMLEALRGAELAGPDPQTIAVAASIEEVWSAAARACGVSHDQLARLVATHFRLAVADFEKAEPRALHLIPEPVARRYSVFPLREDDRYLVVATSDPANLEVEQAIGFASGRMPVFEVAPPAPVLEAINTHYSPDKAIEGLLGNVSEEASGLVSIVEEGTPRPCRCAKRSRARSSS